MDKKSLDKFINSLTSEEKINLIVTLLSRQKIEALSGSFSEKKDQARAHGFGDSDFIIGIIGASIEKGPYLGC